MLALADLAIRTGDTPATRDWLEKAFAAAPGHIVTGIRLTEFLLGQGEVPAASKAVEALAESHSAEPRIVELQGRIAMLERNPGAAANHYAILTDLLPTNASAWQALAKARLMSGDLSGTRDAILRALAIDPAESQVVEDLISRQMDRGRYDAALEIARSLEESETSATLGHFPKGHVLARMDRRAEARAAFDVAAAGGLDRAILRRLVSGYRQIGDMAKAGQMLEDWLKVNPTDMGIRRLAAATMRQDGDYALAIRHYEYLTRVEPQNGAAWAELAWLYETTGSAKSLPAAQKAYELLPEALVVLDTYGWIMVTRGVLGDGVAALEEAYRRSPETSSIAYHLAMARQKQGKGAEACTILEQLPVGVRQFSAPVRTLWTELACQ